MSLLNERILKPLFLCVIIEYLDFLVLTDPKDFSSVEVKSGYCSDLLSCVMTGAAAEGIWITLMAHGNIVAVAALLDLSAILITDGALPDQDTIEKANEKSVTILSTPKSNFRVCGELWEMGICASQN